MKGKPNMAVVDDDPAVHEAIAVALRARQPTWRFASWRSGEEAVERLPDLQTPIVVLDVRMGGMCGLECLDKLRPQLPAARIILFTAFGSKDVAHHANRGRADYLLKKGRSLQALLDLVHSPLHRQTQPGPRLAPRELEFLQLLAADLGNKGIAAQLNLSRQYVDNRLSALYRKLGVQTAAGALARAMNLGICQLPVRPADGEKSTHSTGGDSLP